MCPGNGKKFCKRCSLDLSGAGSARANKGSLLLLGSLPSLDTLLEDRCLVCRSKSHSKVHPDPDLGGGHQSARMSTKIKGLKGLVSKNKRRYQENGYDLDLSYVCDNIIAMGFPADRLEGVYRNHIDDVARFLEEMHPDHYKIYNLCSNRLYNYQKFHGRVAQYPFEDHHPPDLKLMRPFCEDVHNWLKQHPENVVAVHCKAGKGRTGVMICAYLLYVGLFPRPAEALEYYGEQRTLDMNGVTIPSQKRYVEYFGYLLNTNSSHRKIPMVLKSVHFNTIPNFDKMGSQCNPCFAVYCGGKKVYKSQVFEPGRNSKGLTMDVTERVEIEDDVRFDFYHRPVNWLQKREKMFHFWFNTFFVCNCVNKGGKLSPKLSEPHGMSHYADSGTAVSNGHVTTGVRSANSSRGSLPPEAQCYEEAEEEEEGEPPRKKITGNSHPRSMSGPSQSELTVGIGQVEHVLTIGKLDLDRACKDKSHKLFSQDFKVHVFFECLPVEENTQKRQKAANKQKENTLRQSSSADQPISSVVEADEATSSGQLLVPPGGGSLKKTTKFSLDEGHSNVHWSSDSEESDEETDVVCEKARNLRLVSGESSTTSENDATSATTSDMDSSASSGTQRELRKGNFAQNSLGGGEPKSKFHFPGKRRGSMPNPS